MEKLIGHCGPDAVITANFVRNRSPYSVTQKKTHFEGFFGRKPDVSMLRTFGCKAFVHVPVEKRANKLSPKSRTGGDVCGISAKWIRLQDSGEQQ
jgi:hypothetical protein